MKATQLTLKIGKVIAITVVSLAATILLLPELFPGFIAKKIKTWANQNLESKLEFTGARLSFIKHFPSLTLTLKNFSLTGSAPFAADTLLAGKELDFGLDLSSVFKPAIAINKCYINQALINIQTDSAGHANYNIYKSDTTATTVSSDSSTASLQIKGIEISNSRLVYNDRSLPMLIAAEGLNYKGTGDLGNDVFELASNLKIDSLDFYYDNEPYVLRKKLDAQLVTKINTQSLAFVFEKNDLLINQLPVKFTGRFDFLKNGYDIDLRFNSGHTNLHDIFTVLPPQYLHWLSETEMRGDAVIKASFIGKYIAETNTSPDLSFDMQVYGGSINHARAAEPISNLLFKFETVLPNLNPDSLVVNLDTLSFNIGRDYLRATSYSLGTNHVKLHTKLDAELALEKLDTALGIAALDIKGKLNLHFKADGQYNTGINPDKLRPDTVITSIPSFYFTAAVTNGYFKYSSLPKPIENISLDVKAACADNKYQHTTIAVNNLNASLLGNNINGFFRINSLKNLPLEAGLKASVNLDELQQAVPMDSLQLKGKLVLDIASNGQYAPEKNRFPKTNASLQLTDGLVQTPYYPHPISNIQLNLQAVDNSASMAGLQVQIQPLRFSFEGQPFSITASLKNFDNLTYNIQSKGSLDIGRIYQVFSQKGIGVKGFIETNLSLQGTQQDATAGNYEKLHNAGSLLLKNISLSYDEYPKPFLIKNGLIEFKQDKLWLNNLQASYGSNQFLLKGYLENIINYLVKNQPLKGNFELNSNKVTVDEFMAFAGPGSTANTSSSSGVVIVPDNLSIQFAANANTVLYDGLVIKNFTGGVTIDSGRIILNETAFRVADAIVKMNAGYGSQSPKKAAFNFKIQSDSFDIKKVYKEVKLFRDMASAAGKAEGIVSLDYELEGKLDANMMPVYPSLKGGGTISLADIKVYGLKLFSAVSKATGRDSMNNPHLRKVDIKTSIANNIITIKRTKMKVFGFRPRFEGQTSFDGKLNLAFRLGLPPFGIFGIPMTVTGTSANPIVKLRRSKEEDQLEETEEEAKEGE